MESITGRGRQGREGLVRTRKGDTTQRGLLGGLLLLAVGCSQTADAPSADRTKVETGQQSQALTVSAGKRAFVSFESGPVRPIALSPDGSKLFVTNIPDGRLEIFTVDAAGALTASASIPVGMEPVAVAARSNAEVWVVNHLSDSVSVVDVAANPPRVVQTLLVGDEPRDLVFAGAGNSRAFITTAHRGQNRALVDAGKFSTGTADPQLTTPSVPRADVWVYDPANLGNVLGGSPLKVLELFGDTPRPLAVSPDGNTVYAGVHNSGNLTSVAPWTSVCRGFKPNTPCDIDGNTYPGGDFGPSADAQGHPAPPVGLMVKYNPLTTVWADRIGRNWNNAIRFALPDKDVFAINVSTLATVRDFRTVGTTLFNMVTNPVTGKLYVSNLDSNNMGRFEGHSAQGTVQGHLAETRISVIDPASGVVQSRHLNKHIDYAVLKAPASTKTASLSMPLQMVVSGNGSKLYVAAFGSSKVGVYDTASLENNTFSPQTQAAQHISIPGGGPAGIVLSESKSRLYVMTRFDNAVSVINLATKAETQHLKMFNPEPTKTSIGRRFLYDAQLTSSNGESSCASCHIFGDTDHLSWDLGNPDGDLIKTPVTVHLRSAVTDIANLDPEIASEVAQVVDVLNGTGQVDDLHPLKGPMSTQTLRGMQNHGPLHWRGDRVDGFFGMDTSGESGPPFDARHAFKNFIVAFDGLVGLDSQFPLDALEQFADFALELLPPPNPVRNLNNSLTSSQEAGRQYFFGCAGRDSALFMPVFCNESYDGSGGVLDPATKGHGAAGSPLLAQYETCNGCHTMDPRSGFFGTNGTMAFENLPQTIKVPHFRNAYTKVGMFGHHLTARNTPTEDLGVFQGEQIRGFGYQSSGARDTLYHFFHARQFNGRMSGQIGFEGDQQRRDVVNFVMASPSDLAPVVGQQVTLTSSNAAAVGPRIDLLIQRANAAHYAKELGDGVKECELTARVVIAGKQRGFLYRPASSNFETDDGSANLTDASLRALASTAGQQLTFTCVPPGSGSRVALDRDNDGLANYVDFCPNDGSNRCQTCSGTTMDCNNDNVPCQSFTGSNVNHYNAGRATRTRNCLLVLCSPWEYYAAGSGESLGGDNTSRTLYSRNGSSWSQTNCAGNGCETDGNSDVANCGACGNACQYAHAGATCNSGACSMAACAPGFVNCNGSASDGCEASLQNDASNCGACGFACDAGEACVAGNCQCAPNHSDCDGIAANGCEINLAADVRHCGSCTNVCSYPHAGVDCLASTCTLGACAPGFADCNGSSGDGCERNTASDPNNCGGCGISCGSGANGASACEQSACSLACNAGFHDCNGNVADGCERSGDCLSVAKPTVGTGFQFTCAKSSTGGVACWGANDHGQLGRGNTSNNETNKVAIAGLSGVVQVVAGKYHGCALLSGGGVRCWGENGSGQLGDGTTSDRSTPVAVSNLTNAIWIAAGQFHTCAVRANGTAACWGEGGQGQLGHGGTGSKTAPEAVATVSDATQISAGPETTCVVRGNGRVKCWGEGGYGQLGTGNTNSNTMPQDVLSLVDVAQVSVGDSHVVALRANGQVAAWGRNNVGQLGDGTTSNRSTPVTTSGLSSARYVTAGGQHSCAASTTGQAHCWGDNNQGELGDGTTTNRSVPTLVGGIANVAQVVASTRVTTTTLFVMTSVHVHSCAVLTTGQYACWGDNDDGQVGNGGTSERVTAPFVITNVP